MESLTMQVHFYKNPAPIKIFCKNNKAKYCDKANTTEQIF